MRNEPTKADCLRVSFMCQCKRVCHNFKGKGEWKGWKPQPIPKNIVDLLSEFNRTRNANVRAVLDDWYEENGYSKFRLWADIHQLNRM